eukprot:218808-Pelagomonas_calceolata.AAC.5
MLQLQQVQPQSSSGGLMWSSKDLHQQPDSPALFREREQVDEGEGVPTQAAGRMKTHAQWVAPCCLR